MELNLEFGLKIEPKLRARQGKNGWYTPSKTADCEDLLKLMAKRQLPKGFKAIEKKPIELVITFGFKKPKSVPKNRLTPLGRPDLDNYIKLICDAMNKIIWRDDGLIWKVTAMKVYSEDYITQMIVVY